MKVVIQLLFDEIIDELVDGDAAGGAHVFGTQFDFGLGFEDRFLYIDGYRAHYAVSDVCQLLVLVEKLLDGASYGFAESGLMCSALDGMLAVDEGVILIAVLVGMGEGNLDIFALDMDDRIKGRDRHILRQQIQQTVLGDEFLAVIDKRQAGIEVRIVAQQLLNIVIAEMIVLE